MNSSGVSGRKYISSDNVCYNCTQLTGKLGAVVQDHQACLINLHTASVYMFYLHQTSSLAIIATGSADIFTNTHV